jgi:hypothetical protein
MLPVFARLLLNVGIAPSALGYGYLFTAAVYTVVVWIEISIFEKYIRMPSRDRVRQVLIANGISTAAGVPLLMLGFLVSGTSSIRSIGDLPFLALQAGFVAVFPVLLGFTSLPSMAAAFLITLGIEFAVYFRLLGVGVPWRKLGWMTVIANISSYLFLIFGVPFALFFLSLVRIIFSGS